MINENVARIINKAESRKSKNDIRIHNFLERWNNEIEHIKQEEQISKSKRYDMLLLFKCDKGNLYSFIGNSIYSNEDIHDCKIRLEAALNLKVNDENIILRVFDKVKEITLNLFSINKK